MTLQFFLLESTRSLASAVADFRCFMPLASSFVHAILMSQFFYFGLDETFYEAINKLTKRKDSVNHDDE